MDIQAQHHVDEGERSADGYSEYRYAYTEFVISIDTLKAGFRLYDNESVVYARWIEVAGETKMVKWGKSHGAATFPRESEAMKAAIRYFRDTHRVRGVMAYDGPTGGYSEVKIEELV